jgi:glycosyltransferase involved in cell wall biosynthesis
MTRALVISPQPFFSPRGTPLSVYYRALVTAESGVQIDLLTYGEGQDVEIPGLRIIRIPRFRRLGHVKTGPSLLKLFLDVFLMAWTIALLIRRRYAFVHAHEEAVFYCRLLQPIFRFRLLYDMHSSLPQQLANFGYTKSRLLIGLFQRLEDSCLARADAVITICPELADYAVAKMPDPGRHVLIENSIFDDVQPTETAGPGDAVTQSELDEAIFDAIPHVPLVLYTGSLEPYQGVDLLIRAFRKVRLAEPDTAMAIVGGHPRHVRQLRQLADEQGLNGACMFIERIAQPLVSKFLQRAAVVVSPRIAGTNTPLKIYQYLACGVPLVATRIPSHTQVLKDDECWLVEPTPEAMAQGIRSALFDQEGSRLKVHAALAHYRRDYSLQSYRRKLRRVLQILGCQCVPEGRSSSAKHEVSVGN